MAAAFGVHVGSSTACLALHREGKTDVVANDAGDRVTPTIVSFYETEDVVGLAAKSGLVRNGANTIIHNKKVLSLAVDDPELQCMIDRSLYKIVVENDRVKYELKRGNKTCFFTPEDVSRLLYHKLHSVAISSMGSDEELRAIVTVPHHFTLEKRQAVKKSAEAAGFSVVQMISEQASALLAYGIGIKDASDSHCVVYRCGGVSMDVTVVQVVNGMFSIKSYIHKKSLGGDKFTKLLSQYLAGEFRHKWKLDPEESKRSMLKLYNAAETCKHVLSMLSSAHCFVESLYEGVDLSVNVSRARFENLLSSAIDDYVQPVYEVLDKADVKFESVKSLVLCGGSLKIPKMQQTICDLFPNAEVCSGINPDEVIALGAAKEASYLPKKHGIEDLVHLSVEVPAISVPVYLKAFNEKDKFCVIPAFTPLPVKRTKMYETNGEQDEFGVELFVKDGIESDNFKFVGKVILDKLTKATQLVVQVSINRNGGFSVKIHEKGSNRNATVRIDPQT